jgi:epoxide hydrolase
VIVGLVALPLGVHQTTPTPGAAPEPRHDITIRRLAERDHNIVRWVDLDRGGHFLALEEPQVLVDEVRTFFPR